ALTCLLPLVLYSGFNVVLRYRQVFLYAFAYSAIWKTLHELVALCAHKLETFFFLFFDALEGILIISPDDQEFVFVAFLAIGRAVHQAVTVHAGGFVIAKIIVKLSGLIIL